MKNVTARAPIGAETFEFFIMCRSIEGESADRCWNILHFDRCFLLLAKTDLHWFCGKIYHLDFQLCFFGDVERRLDLDGDELPGLE